MHKKLKFYCLLLFLLFTICNSATVYATDTTVFTGIVTADTGFLNSGNYQLNNDTSLENILNVSGNVTLDLNGNILNLNGYYICVQSNSVLNIYDSGGDKTHLFSINENGLYIPDKNGTITISGGCITGGKGFVNDESVTFSGAIVINGILNLHGGNIVGNSSMYGGAFLVSTDAIFNMYGGCITGNLASENGGAGYLHKSSTVNIFGGSISHNNAARGGAMYSGSNCKINI